MSAETVTSPPAKRIRPFYWSVRRELWENPAIYLAPLTVAAVALFGFLISTVGLPGAVRRAEATAEVARFAVPGDVVAAKAASRASNALEIPYDAVAGLVFMTALVVGFFYCLSALHGERRDRSILFWKSLPVSDLMAVLGKAFVPLAIAPVVVFAVVFPTHLIMLAWSSLVMGANGLSMSQLTPHLPFPFLWAGLARGLIVMALWYAPVVGWLLLVSAWARRMPILWAFGPWVAICIVERLAFNSKLVLGLLADRLTGGYAIAFEGSSGRSIHGLADLDPTPVLVHPGLWLGLAVAAALLAGAVRLRRYRDPI